MRKRNFAALLLCFSILSCDKEDNETTETKTDILVKQSWKFDNAGFDIGRNGTIDADISSQVATCISDNSVTFSANGNGTVDEGATKCTATAPQTSPFTWSFASNETAININGNVVAGVSGQFKILDLTSTKFSLSKDTTVQGVPGALIVNLKH